MIQRLRLNLGEISFSWGGGMACVLFRYCLNLHNAFGGIDHRMVDRFVHFSAGFVGGADLLVDDTSQETPWSRHAVPQLSPLTAKHVREICYVSV